MNKIKQITLEDQTEFDLAPLVRDIEASKNQNPITAHTTSREERIKKLHAEVSAHFLVALGKAIEIGGLLAEQKISMKHGEWMPWLREHMPFSTATARNYMRLWEKRDELKMLNVSNLNMAYKITKGSGPAMLSYTPEGFFDSLKYPDPFSHCDDEQKRKWLAKFILHIQAGLNPWDAWAIMEWTVVRFTFDDYFDETKNALDRYNMKGIPAMKKKEAKKQVAEFLDRWKDIDLLKLKFSCLSFWEPSEMSDP